MAMDKRIKMIIDFITKGHKVVEDTSKEIKGLPKKKTVTISVFDAATKAITAISTGYMALIQLAQRASAAVKRFTDAADIQAQKEQRLETIARAASKATDEQIESIKQLSAALQENTVISDEVAIAGASQLASFNLTAESVERLLPVLQNLGVATYGVKVNADQLEQSANLLGKVFTGQVGALSRVGVSFNEVQEDLLKTGDEATKVNTLIEVMNQNFGNLAKDMVQTDVGALQQYQNKVGDLNEEIGNLINEIRSRAVPGLMAITDAAIDLIKASPAEEIRNEQLEFNALVSILADASNAQEVRNMAINQLQSQYPAYLGNLDLERATTEDLAKLSKSVNDEFERKIQLAVAEQVMSEASSDLAKAIKAQFEAQKAYNIEKNKTPDLLIDDAARETVLQSLSNAVVRAKQNVDDFREAYNSTYSELMSQGLIPPQTTASVSEVENQLSQIESTLANLTQQEQVINLRTTVDGEPQAEQEPDDVDPFYMWNGFSQDDLEAANAQMSQTLTAQAFQLNNSLLAMAKSRITNEMNAELSKLRKSAEYQAASAEEQAKLEDDIRKEYAKKQNQLAVAERVNSIAQIAFNTAQGIMKAVAAFPLTAGQPWAGITATMGAAQTGVVLGTPLPKYAKGGIADSPSIFGEAGPEAAVPLPDGRSIPVNMNGGISNKKIDELIAVVQAVNANIAALDLSVTIETTDPEARIRSDNERLSIMRGAGDDGQPL